MIVPELLLPVVTDPRGASVVCDFDGTISAIVADPADAVPLPGALDALGALAQRIGSVAVVSGRPVAWLAQQLAPIADAPIELHGMYGLETWHGAAAVAVDEAVPWRAVIDGITAAAIASMPASVLVEPKGLSVGLHYRAKPDDEPAVMSWAREQVQVHGVALLTGRLAVELRPPIDRDKGHATAEFLVRHRPRAVVFLGDDTGDVPAGQAVRSYAAATHAAGVVICVDSAETPAAMRDIADLRVAGPTEAVALLAALAREAEVKS